MNESRAALFPDCDLPSRDKRNQRRIIVWSLLWTLSWLTVALAAKNGWVEGTTFGIAGTALSVVLGTVVLVVYRRYLREADELRRKIELDALALAFGVGLVGGIAYYLLERTGVVAEADLLMLVVAMIVTHSAGVVIGFRRFS